MSQTFNPQIYVACLAAYNNGYLHGAWIDAGQPSDTIHDEIQAMLKKSPIPQAEEWAIHDFDDFGNLNLDENEDLETVSALAEFIVQHGELGIATLDHMCNDLSEAERLLEDGYEGAYNSEEEFARQLYESCYEIPDHLIHYIDYQAIADDLFCSDYFSVDIGLSKHVFRNT